MAFTERELEISNKSYTNKDFAAIYEELLTYAEKISNRFSPTTAVETDPFVVLLKLAAFVADKVNYNIDKNILEMFISSCTQEESMRELTESLGYHMHYYVAAQTTVVCSYKKPEELISNIVIPRYSVIESSSKIAYVTMENAEISKTTNTSGEISVIQGKIQHLSVLGNNLIQLENLTSNNRLYFPEVMVAENGVIISNSLYGSSLWEKVDNLNTQIYGSPCYKFGFDSKRNLPYIEFPEWVSDIIGDGLTVDYVVTQGEIGNVAAKELINIKKRTVIQDGQVIDDGIDNADIRVTNLSAAVSGSNPETLDQSYLGFKKIIGTFDTLVTCRDYANVIYNMLNQTTGTPLVSNVQVADRRTDINYACDVVTYDVAAGSIVESIPKAAITPFDLTIYPFRPITNTTFSAINSNTDGYNNSFKLLPQNKINAITAQIETNTNLYKNLSHTYKTLANEDIVSIQLCYDLTATISTTAKVNILEQSDIIANVYSALAKEFNARKLNFGYEIPFEKLIDVMKNADARIKAVSLQEPEQTPKIITKDGDEHDIYIDSSTDSDEFKKIVAKNVLGGRVPLFEYDNDFTPDYSYEEVEKITGVKRITTECNIDTIDGGNSYTLKDNEVVQFIAPNIISENIYAAGVLYYLELNSGTDIPANTDYLLKSGETLLLYYFKDNKWTYDFITSGKIINSRNILYTEAGHTANSKSPDKNPTINSETYPVYYLGPDEQIEIKKINSEKLVIQKKCYWITNEPKNEIKWEGDVYTLKENEYFFYSDPNLTSLYAFGSGTKLKRTSGMSNWNWECDADINIDDINLEGLYALRDSFKTVVFTSENYLEITENEIKTFTAGDTIYIGSGSPSLTITDNDFTLIDDGTKISYQYANTSDREDLPDKSLVPDADWSCRSILDINCGPNLEQVLVSNQKIYYSIDDSAIDTEDSGTYDGVLEQGFVLKANTLIQKGGGKNINLGVFTLANLEDFVYPTLLKISKATDCAIQVLENGMYGPNFDGSGEAKFYAADVADVDCYVMIYGNDIGEVAKPTLQAYDSDSNPIGNDVELNNGINILKLTLTAPTAAYWILNRLEPEQSFTMSPLKYVKGINPLLGLKSDLATFITYLETEFGEQYEKFYPFADLDPSKEIELSETVTLNTAQAFYDSNNIANKWVLPKIDFSASKDKIRIAKSSMK